MPPTKFKLITTREHLKRPVHEVLADWLTTALRRPVSKAKARKLVIAGAVHANGRRVTLATPSFSAGVSIDASVDIAKLFGDSTSRDKPFELTPDRILFEDADLIFVDKPPGLPAHQTLDETRDSLFAAVRRFLKKRDRIDNPYLGVHQRLDRDTSGVVLFTKSKRVNAAIARSFSDHATVKVYQAITVAGSDLQPEWTIKNELGKVSSSSKKSMYGSVRSGGQFAETAVRILARYPLGLWIEAIPKTGRTHQIRVHLAEYGLPIIGDDLYSSPEKWRELARLEPRLMLHATRLVVPHPVTARKLSVQSPLPPDFERCRHFAEKG